MAAASNVMSYKLLRKYVEAELKSILEGREQEFSYLVEGPHGIGKSAFWKELCLNHDGYFVDLRLGQRDLGDIIGLPTIIVDSDETKHMVHVKPELVRKMFVSDLKELGVIGDTHDPKTYRGDKLAKFRPVDRIGKPYQFILGFLDEYNRGTKDVQQAVFELVYDRSMNGDRVHPKVLLAAACNDNLEIYTITEGDPAFRSRFKTIKYAPEPEEWLKWGRETGELCEELIFTIEGKKELADPPKKQDIDYLNQPHPNRRSWHEFSKFFVQFRSFFSDNEMEKICSTFVGQEAAQIFKLMVSERSKIKTKGKETSSAETAKVDQFYSQFIRLHKMTPDAAKKELNTFSPDELQALADHCILHFNEYNYMTGVTKDRVEALAQLLPAEVFARIWNEVDNKNGLREKMAAYVGNKGKPDFFKQFEGK